MSAGVGEERLRVEWTGDGWKRIGLTLRGGDWQKSLIGRVSDWQKDRFEPWHRELP